MMTIDEKLSAYLDNMLAADERAALEALLAADPALADRLEMLALANAEFVARAADVDGLEMSGALKRQLASLEAAAGAGDEKVVAFRTGHGFAGFLTDHRALAACAAIAAGLFAWQAVQPEPGASGGGDTGGLVYAGSHIAQMLDTAPSGAPVTLRGGSQGEVRFSFPAADGTYCRLADVSAGGAASRLVACREADAWRIVIAASMMAPESQSSDLYRAASAGTVQTVEALLDTLMADGPLSPEDEQDLIGREWRLR